MQTTSLEGRSIIVTGATSGIGYFIAEGLATLGARVILAARSAQKAEAAIRLLPGADRHHHLPLDLADLHSIRTAGALIGGAGPTDGIVMNAGVIAASPSYTSGPFGTESTVDVNVVAHMEFLRLVMPALREAPAARIVSTGSMLTRKIPFDRSNWLAQTTYRPRVAYAMSKHAAEILGVELDRRLAATGSAIRSIVTHPGSAIDALTPDRPPLHQRPLPLRIMAPILAPAFSTLVQGKESAAQPAIAAMTATALPTPAYIGPGRRSAPTLATPASSTTDTETGAWLWDEIERILGNPIM